MNSIGNTLNSINSSLISEISSYLSTKATSSTSSTSTSSTSTSSTSSSSTSDSLDVSQIGKLFQELQHLQEADPGKLKEVLQEAAGKLKDAAGKATDTQQAKFLNDLASHFQEAADTGSLSALKPPAPSDGGYSPSGRTSTEQDLVAALLQNQGSSSTGDASLLQSLLKSISSDRSGSGSGGM